MIACPPPRTFRSGAGVVSVYTATANGAVVVVIRDSRYCCGVSGTFLWNTPVTAIGAVGWLELLIREGTLFIANAWSDARMYMPAVSALFAFFSKCCSCFDRTIGF